MSVQRVRRWLVAVCLALALAPQFGGASHVFAAGKSRSVEPERIPDDCRITKHSCQCD